MSIGLWLAIALLWVPFLLNRLGSGWDNGLMAPVILAMFFILFALISETLELIDGEEPEGEAPVKRRIRRRLTRRGRRWRY